jgi:hypothetical protein
MKQMSRHATWLARLGGVVLLAPLGAAAEFPVAGTQPYARPVGAPTITEVRHDQAWYVRALTGVSQPIPPSLGWLEYQGNWYTPFIRPGMLPRYDIRGWHGPR